MQLPNQTIGMERNEMADESSNVWADLKRYCTPSTKTVAMFCRVAWIVLTLSYLIIATKWTSAKDTPTNFDQLYVNGPFMLVSAASNAFGRNMKCRYLAAIACLVTGTSFMLHYFYQMETFIFILLILNLFCIAHWTYVFLPIDIRVSLINDFTIIFYVCNILASKSTVDMWSHVTYLVGGSIIIGFGIITLLYAKNNGNSEEDGIERLENCSQPVISKFHPIVWPLISITFLVFIMKISNNNIKAMATAKLLSRALLWLGKKLQSVVFDYVGEKYVATITYFMIVPFILLTYFYDLEYVAFALLILNCLIVAIWSYNRQGESQAKYSIIFSFSIGLVFFVINLFGGITYVFVGLISIVCGGCILIYQDMRQNTSIDNQVLDV
jgi:uncharacterized membrane protein YidH (DUF202 family)